MKQRPFLRCLSLLLALLCLFSLLPPAPSAASQPDITSCIEGIIAWKTAENGSPLGGVLINDAYLESAGTTAGDWYPFALGRYGRADNLRGYLAVVSDRVSARYGESGRLHAYKATEWHRIALAVSACGGNPRGSGSSSGASASSSPTWAARARSSRSGSRPSRPSRACNSRRPSASRTMAWG